MILFYFMRDMNFKIMFYLCFLIYWCEDVINIYFIFKLYLVLTLVNKYFWKS